MDPKYGPAVAQNGRLDLGAPQKACSQETVELQRIQKNHLPEDEKQQKPRKTLKTTKRAESRNVLKVLQNLEAHVPI